MLKTEKQLWQKLKHDFRHFVSIRFTRIETATKNGVPDVFYTNGKKNGWIELKVVLDIPHRNIPFCIKKLKLSANQINWGIDTPNCYVLAAVRFLDDEYRRTYFCFIDMKELRAYEKYRWSEVVNYPYNNFVTACRSLIV